MRQRNTKWTASRPEVRLELNRAPGSVGKDEVGLDGSQRVQRLQQRDAVLWCAGPRPAHNQSFSLRLLDELVVVPVHTFVKVHGVAHEASSSTFGMWSHTFVRAPTQSFCAYAG